MKYLKMLGLAAVSAMALLAVVGASSASATTLETVGGATTNTAVTLTASLEPTTTLKLKDTTGLELNTCTGGHVKGTTTKFTNPVTGPVEELTFTGCSHNVTIDNTGKLYVEQDLATTHGKVYSEEAEVTSFSTIFNEYLNCKTGVGTLLGTLTAASADTTHATLKVNASLDCFRTSNGATFTAKWEGAYEVTTPTGLGVSA